MHESANKSLGSADKPKTTDAMKFWDSVSSQVRKHGKITSVGDSFRFILEVRVKLMTGVRSH